MNDTREVYSIQDCLHIVDEVIEKQLGLGDEVREVICKTIEHDFKYVNWIRFQGANCPGCVGGPKECDIAYGKGEYHGTWDKIVKGELQSCPRRVNGTMIFNSNEPEKGMQSLDIADHKFNVVEPLKEN